MSEQPIMHIHEPLLQSTIQQILQQTTDSVDSKIILFVTGDLLQTSNQIDFDLYNSQESVMRRVWDNPDDDVWDTDQST